MSTSLPMIQVNTPERVKKHSLPKEIAKLLSEVKQLREDTESLVCHCNQADCPFQESHSLDIQQIECSFDFRSDSPRLRKKGIAIANNLALRESPSLKGIERRGDGTIVEKDGPRTSGEESLEKRLMKSYMYNTMYNCGLGTHLSVSTLSDSQDCLVDNDNLFGTSSDDDNTFSRFEPTRRHVKRNGSKSPKLQKRRITLIPSSTTFPLSQLGEMRKISVGNGVRPLSRFLRNAASLPSCAYFEDDEESLSTCSSSSSLTSTSYAPQCNELSILVSH